jgi:hypothetical protein
MITRRAVLRHGVYASLSAAATSVIGPTVRAQSSSSGGFDFYISPTGSDSNPGTHDRPWAITAINTRQRDYAGKRVGLLDGTYNVFVPCQTGRDSTVGLEVNGGPNAASPTVIAAVNARKAILTDINPATGAPATTGAPIIGQGYLRVPNKGNVILDGLYIHQAWGAAIFFLPLVPPSNPEGGATGIIIRNCEIDNVGGIVANNVGAIKLRWCTGAVITNNTIHSVQPDPGKANPGNAVGIFSFCCHSNIYEYNTIFDCGSGIHDKNAHNGNHTYRYNLVESAGTYPINAIMGGSGGDAGDVLTAHNNLLIAPGKAVWDGSNVPMPSHQSLVFYNNTCVGGGFFYPAYGQQSSPPAMVTLYNNILTNVLVCNGSVALSNYNVFTNTRAAFAQTAVTDPRGKSTRYTLSEWQKATDQDRDSTTFASAPETLFLAAAKLDAASYQLQPTAVGRNLGRVGGRASGAATDVGAWGGGATRIGCNFRPTPRSPLLKIG